MARYARFAQASFALWPDESLLEAVQSFPGERVSILRTELHHASPRALTVDLTDEFYCVSPKDDWIETPSTDPDPRHHSRLLRLTWEDHWKDNVHHGNRIFALESYDGFYAGPFFTFHPTRQGVSPSSLYEVVSDPDPWIAEILEENNNTDVFPPYGVPAAVSQGFREREGDVRVTGRFFPESAQPHDTGSDYIFSLPDSESITPEHWAEAQAEVARVRAAQWQAQRSRPRYRHLLIASNTHLLEILSEDLPHWTWVNES